MRWLWNLVTSSIGAKALMAVTGAFLVLFLIVHMLGNLQLFSGQDTLNAYGVLLRAKPSLLWTARIGLIVVFLLHLIASLRLSYLNNAARPVGYGQKKPIVSSFASRWMLVSGIIVLAFIAYHLLHFTFHVTDPQYGALADPQGRFDVYTMVITAFRDPLVSGTYIVAMVLLGFHLWHAIGSIFQTLGANSPKYNSLIQGGSLVVAAILVIGNISMPIAVLAGWVQTPPGVM